MIGLILKGGRISVLCPYCNKFCAFDTGGDPEVDVAVSVTLKKTAKGAPDKNSATASITGTARIVLTSECCSADMKEATFDISDLDIDVVRAAGCKCDLTDLNAEATSQEITDRTQSFSERVAKRGPLKGQVVRKMIPYRYQKRYYGVEAEITVTCNCRKTKASATFNDEIQASGMDEMI